MTRSRAPDRLSLVGGKVVLARQIVSEVVTLAGGRIESIGGPCADTRIELEGDFLLPGLVEIHTDNLERHLEPRPGVMWDPIGAVVAHDLELAGSGILTAFDAISIGDTVPDGFRSRLARVSIEAIETAIAGGCLRADHWLHLRCELGDPEASELFAPFAGSARVGLVSLMDHTPGQRQWRDLAIFRKAYGAKHGLTSEALDALIAERQASQKRHLQANRRKVLALAREHERILASHDDAEPEHVYEAVADGLAICEFPTSAEAALAAREAGRKIVVGAPNVLRGGSHSGNVSATALIEVADAHILSSDYYPPSLLAATFRLTESGLMDLPSAVAMASSEPAQALHLADRGEIAPGMRADLIRVRKSSTGPVVISGWREGCRIV